MRRTTSVVGKLPRCERRDERRVPWPNAELSLDARQPDFVALDGESALLGRDDFERERHRGQAAIVLDFARAPSIEPTI